MLARRSQLTTAELARVARFHFEHDRHSAAVVRLFIRQLLSHYAAVAPAQWRFETGAHGRPEIIAPPLPLRFNLSHCDNLVVAAVVQRHSVGVDCELTRRQCSISALAERFFAPTEAAELRALPPEAQRQRFFDLWTLKESYIKALGLGLAQPLNQFTFRLLSRNGEEEQITLDDNERDFASNWRYWLLRPTADYRIAITLPTITPLPYRLVSRALLPTASVLAEPLQQVV